MKHPGPSVSLEQPPRGFGGSRLITASRARWVAVCLAFIAGVACGQPSLRVQQLPDGFLIAWPASASDFVLQGSPLVIPPDWRDLPESPQIVGDEFTVFINLDTEEQLFRLANRPLPTSLPTLHVASDTAFSGEQLARLLEAIGADPQQTQSDPRGLIFFLDPARFQSVPSVRITDEEIIKRLEADTEEEGGPSLFEAFDLDKLKLHQPFSRRAALQTAQAALKAAGLLPEETRFVPSHTRLALMDLQNRPLLDPVLLDTRVNLEIYHKGIPLTGPGARIAMSFDPEGKPSQLLFSFRPLEEGPAVPILDERTALERSAKLFPPGARLFKPRLMYFLPSVQEATGRAILPYFECAASIEQNGQQIDLLRRLIPATDDQEFLPAVQLTAKLDGRLATGEATVVGGLAPYRFRWVSSSADLSNFPEDAASIEYVLGASEGRGPEILTVIVTDANGVEVSAMADLGTAGAGVPGGPEPVASITDFGVERAVSDLGSGIQSGFISRFKQSASLAFNFSGIGAWERDFKQGGTGLDHIYVDNVDLTFYIGHGSPGGFTFESNQDDGSIVPGDVTGDWGNLDLEWMCLVSCQVLKWSSGGQNVVQRWGPAFDRMHMLLGFDTNAYDWSGFGNRFANYALGFDLGFFQLPPMPIRVSWFLAKQDQQPASVVAGAMGPIGPGNASNCNEYFWGKGVTGPDISKANIQGWWVLYYQ